MSLRPDDEHPIPEATRRVARAAFPKGTLAMRLADQLGAIYADEQFAALFPVRGQPALSPARLALVTVLQFAEGLSDRQAADAVRGRIDWKYALGLELADPGFDCSVLSEFRARLVGGRRGSAAARHAAWRAAASRAGASARPAAHRLDPRAGGGARAQPAGAGRRDAAPRAERARGGRPGLAARPGAGRVVRALRRAGSRTTRLPAERGGARGRWRRRSARTGSSCCAASTARRAPAWLREVPAVTGAAAGLGAAVPRPRRRAGSRWRAVEATCPPAGLHRLALRPRRPLQHQARDRLGRLQGPPDRDLRRRTGRT